MSLLNDALRKQRRFPPSAAAATAAAQPVAALQRPWPRKRWVSVSLGLLLAAVCIIWGIRTLRPAAKDLSPPNSALAKTRPDPAPPFDAANPPRPAPLSTPSEVSPPLAPADPSSELPTAVLEKSLRSHAPTLSQTRTATVDRRATNDRPPVARHPSGADAPADLKPPANRSGAPAAAKPAASPVATGAVESLYRQARIFHRKKQLDPAIAGYRAVLQKAPEHSEAQAGLAAAYIEADEYDKAREIAAALHRRDESHPQALVNLAIALIGSGRPEEALRLLEPAARRPGAPHFDIWLHLGIAHRQLGQLAEALACYRQAEALTPNAPPLLFNLALVQDERQDYAAAIHSYQRYLAAANDLENPVKQQIEGRIHRLRAYTASQARQEINR